MPDLRTVQDIKDLTNSLQSQVGQKLEVLTETCNRSGNWEGWSDNYLRVEALQAPEEAGENRLVHVYVETVTAKRRLRGTWCR